MKKRIVLLVLSCMLVMLMAACGVKPAEPKEVSKPKPTEIPAATATPEALPTKAPTEAPKATETPEPTATPKPTKTPKPTATPEPVAQGGYKKGIVSKNSFESEWMNLRFTLPSGAKMLSQEELDVLMKKGVGLLYGDNADVVLDYTSLTVVTEMMAQYPDGANVLIQVEKLSSIYKDLTAEDYLSISVANLQNSEANVETTVIDSYTLEWCGEVYEIMEMQSNYGTGQYIYQEYLARKKDNCMISIILTYTEASNDNAGILAQMFSAYDEEPAVEPEYPDLSDGVFDGGVWNGRTYENPWLGFKFTVPTGVEIYDDEAEGVISIEAEWADGLPIVQMLTEEKDDSNMTVEEYLYNVAAMLTEMKSDEGFTYTVDEELYLIEIAGQEYIDLSTVVDVYGTPLYQEYCVREQDGYFFCIIFTFAEDDSAELEEALSAFTPY